VYLPSVYEKFPTLPPTFHHTRVWGSGFEDVPVAFRNLIDPAAKDYDPRDKTAYAIPYAEYANKEDGLGYTWEFPEDKAKAFRVQQTPSNSRKSIPATMTSGTGGVYFDDYAIADEIDRMERECRTFDAMKKPPVTPSISDFDRWVSERDRFARGESELSVVLMFVRLEDAGKYDKFWASDVLYQHGVDRDRPRIAWWFRAWVYFRGLGWYRHGQDNPGPAHRGRPQS
jgi:hypothetical protein